MAVQHPELVVPAVQYVPSMVEAMKEGYSRDTTRKESAADIASIESSPEAFIKEIFSPKDPYVELPNGEKAPRVQATLLWLVLSGRFLGSISIRHTLTPQLEQFAGHIGYSIRPSEQGKGYGTRLLKLGKEFSSTNLGIIKLLVTCDSENEASIRVIEKNGGRLIDVTPHPFSEHRYLNRYWVQ